MRASTKRILSIFLSGLFLIGIIVVSSSLIQPEFNNVMEKRAVLHSKQNIFQNQQNIVDEVQNLISELQGFDELQEVVSLAMPIEKSTPQMLGQLAAIARNSGVIINSFESSAQPFAENNQSLVDRLGNIRTTIAISGPYDNVSRFVELMETNVRIFDVEEIILSQSGPTDGGSITAVINFDAYFQEN